MNLQRTFLLYYFAWNKIRNDGVKGASKALKENSSLTKFDLSHAHIKCSMQILIMSSIQ